MAQPYFKSIGMKITYNKPAFMVNSVKNLKNKDK